MHSRSTEGCVVGRGANTPRSPCLPSIWYILGTVYRRFIAVGQKVPSWPSLLSPQLHHQLKNCISVVGKRWWWRWRWILIYDPRHQRVCDWFASDRRRFWFTQRLFPPRFFHSFFFIAIAFVACGTWPNVSSHICMHMHVFVCVFALVGHN